MAKPGEIYLVKDVGLGLCTDARPCVDLAVLGNKALVCCLSAQFDCAEDAEVTLLKTDPDFAASGLKKDSYIPAYRELRIPIDALKRTALLGHAVGEFKRKIEALYGAPLI
jgi:hypothetical protein